MNFDKQLEPLPDRPIDPPEGDIDVDKLYEEYWHVYDELTRYRQSTEIDDALYFLQEYSDYITEAEYEDMEQLIEAVKTILKKDSE